MCLGSISSVLSGLNVSCSVSGDGLRIYWIFLVSFECVSEGMLMCYKAF